MLALPIEAKTRCWYTRDETEARPRRDVTSRDVIETLKVHVELIAVVKLGLFFTFITSRRVNVIINYRFVTRNSTHIV